MWNSPRSPEPRAPLPTEARRRRPRAEPQPRRESTRLASADARAASTAGTSPASSRRRPRTAPDPPRAPASSASKYPPGAWAERVNVPADTLAPLPDAVTFEQAATLPVAGLTALRAYEQAGLLLGKRVAVTGASGGVGLFALQLARLSGAHVTAIARRGEGLTGARRPRGRSTPSTPRATRPSTSSSTASAARLLGAALQRDRARRHRRLLRLAPSRSPSPTPPASSSAARPAPSCTGCSSSPSWSTRGPPRADLDRLADLVATGDLTVDASHTASWTRGAATPSPSSSTARSRARPS